MGICWALSQWPGSLGGKLRVGASLLGGMLIYLFLELQSNSRVSQTGTRGLGRFDDLQAHYERDWQILRQPCISHLQLTVPLGLTVLPWSPLSSPLTSSELAPFSPLPTEVNRDLCTFLILPCSQPPRDFSVTFVTISKEVYCHQPQPHPPLAFPLSQHPSQLPSRNFS